MNTVIQNITKIAYKYLNRWDATFVDSYLYLNRIKYPVKDFITLLPETFVSSFGGVEHFKETPSILANSSQTQIEEYHRFRRLVMIAMGQELTNND